MEIKERTKRELGKGVRKIDKFIANHGVGSGYLSKARRIQRGINVALALGIVTTIAGLLTWAFYKQDKK